MTGRTKTIAHLAEMKSFLLESLITKRTFSVFLLLLLQGFSPNRAHIFTRSCFFGYISNLLLNVVVSPQFSNVKWILHELELRCRTRPLWGAMFEISRTEGFFSSSLPAKMRCMQVSVLQLFVIVTSFSVCRTTVTEIGTDRPLSF